MSLRALSRAAQGGRLTMIVMAALAMASVACAERKASADSTARPRDSTRSSVAPPPAVPPAAASPAAGLHLATTAEGDPAAWLFHLDPAARSGRLYLPPGVRALCSVNAQPSGTVSWRTAADGGLTIGFDGSTTASGMTGQIQRFRRIAGRDSAVAADSVTVLAVADDSTARVPTGVYSSFDYNEEGGDLNGMELVLVRSTRPGGAMAGLLSVAEGAVGMATPITDVVSAGEAVEFTAHGGGADERYVATRTANGIALSGRDHSRKPRTLRRLGAVTAYLTRDVQGRDGRCTNAP